MELTKQGRPPLPPRPRRSSVPVSMTQQPERASPPAKANPQMLESLRSKLREALAAALSIMDSGQQSSANAGSASEYRIRKAQSLASKIEEELFKLFGGVSRKYKEKGASLVFNLEGEHNPVLREMVLSEQISPKWLCAMTIGELVKMFRLKIQVDDRGLVRKTHKGEFLVEAEETDEDVFRVPAGPRGDSLPSEPIIALQTKSSDDETASAQCRETIKELDDSTVQDDEVVGTWNSSTSSDLEYLAGGINDLVLQPRYDVLNGPEIVSFSDFPRIVASEPHFKHRPIGAPLQDDRNSNKAEKVNSANFPITMDMAAVSEFQIHSEDVPSQQSYCESKLESPMNKPASVLDPVEEPKGDVLAKSSPQMVDAEESRTVNGLTTESSMQCKITPDVSLTRHSIWEATIQHESSRTNIVVIFKSGEKPSTHQWHRFLRIEGRVRLSALKEFLIELLKSRSRTILVTELRWKEGSLESGRHHLLKTIDSYTANETVGLVKPAQGITLYLCPSQGKAAQILADHLPKEHLRSLTVSRTSIIGVVVWQRPHASSREVVAADVPPGVGSRVVRHQDGLPAEYNLVSVSNSAADVTRTQSYKSHQLPVHTSNDTRIEEIIRKYDKTHSQGNLQQERIQQPHYPYQQYHQQLQHHSMRQYHMARNSHSPLAYTQHQNTAMPVRGRPLIYGHPMQPAQQSYSGVPDDGSQTHVTRAWYLQ
nr:uncharacterized protein LOC109770998 [Aegilops tauschii subsp. strangulata]